MVVDRFQDGPRAGELSLAQYLSLIDELAAFRPTFYITGGEPLLSDKTAGIIETLKAHGLYASLNTNGVLLKEHAELLVASGLDKIILSLDGPPEVHNAIRGETFDRIEEGLISIARAKKERHSRTPAVRVQCLISPLNAGSLCRTIETVRRLGIAEIRFQHLMFAGSGGDYRLPDALKAEMVYGNVSLPALPPGSSDPVALKAEIADVLAEKRPPLVRFEPDIGMSDINAYYEMSGDTFRNDCLSPWRRLVISAHGEMGSCQGVYLARYPETTPARAWWGERFRGMRRHVIEKGLFPHCSRCCHREYYTPRLGLEIS